MIWSTWLYMAHPLWVPPGPIFIYSIICLIINRLLLSIITIWKSPNRTTNQIDRSPESGTVELIQSDLRNLSNETRKRFGPIKEAAESAILKIKTLTSLNAKLKESPLAPLRKHCQIVLQPFLMGCDTKNAEIILLCLTSIQRLITHKILNEGASGNIVSILWQLMEYNIEEVRLLQTSMLLLTTTDYVQGPTLSKCLVLCFRNRSKICEIL